MPHATAMREAIRDSWLDKDYWDELGVNIHPVFLIGSTFRQLDHEIEKYDDILQINFTESHYLLPIKDNVLLDYVAGHCAHAHYVFKGDDDIFLVPDNILTLIGQLKKANMSSIGCKSDHDKVVKDLRSKYFVPDEIYAPTFYPPYFSGAAYVITGQLATIMAERKSEVPIMPLDDCYIGSIIKHIGK